MTEEKNKIIAGVNSLTKQFETALNTISSEAINITAGDLTEYGVELTFVNQKISEVSQGIKVTRDKLEEALANQIQGITQDDVNNMIDKIAELQSINADLNNQITKLQNVNVLTNLVVNGDFTDGSNNWTSSEPLNFGVGLSGAKGDSIEIAPFSNPTSTSTVNQNLGSNLTDGDYIFKASVISKQGDGGFNLEILDSKGGSVLVDGSIIFGRTEGEFLVLLRVEQEPSLVGQDLTLVISPKGELIQSVDQSISSNNVLSFPTRASISNIGLFNKPTNVNISTSTFNNFIDSGSEISLDVGDLNIDISQALEIEFLKQQNEELERDVVNFLGLFDLITSSMRAILSDDDPLIIEDLTFHSSQNQDTLNKLVSKFNNDTTELQQKLLSQQNTIKNLENQLDLLSNSETIIDDPLSSTYRFTLTGGDILGSGIGADLFNLDKQGRNIFSFDAGHLNLLFRNTLIPEFSEFSEEEVTTIFAPNKLNVSLFSKSNLLTPSTITTPSVFIAHCSNSDFGSNHDSNVSQIPHTHRYSFLTEDHGYITFLFKILNFDSNTTFDDQSPALSELLRPSISTDISSGLQFEITVQGGPSRGWEFAVNQYGSNVILNDSTPSKEWSIINNLILSDYNLTSNNEWMNENPINIKLIGEKISSNEQGDSYASSVAKIYSGAPLRMTKII